jgi:hypothetical protein
MKSYVNVYDSPTDIFSYFRNKEAIREFLSFFLKEAVGFSEMIVEKGSNKPFPVVYDAGVYLYQTDYHFFIYVLAKWVGIKTGEVAKGVYVLRDYAITGYSRKRKEKMLNRQFLAMFLSDRIKIFSNRHKDKDVLFSKYPTNGIKVFDYNGEAYEYLILSFHNENVEHYFADFSAYVGANDRYFNPDNVEIKAFGYLESVKFWEKMKAQDVKKRYYFPIKDDDYLGMFEEIIERNAIS